MQLVTDLFFCQQFLLISSYELYLLEICFYCYNLVSKTSILHDIVVM